MVKQLVIGKHGVTTNSLGVYVGDRCQLMIYATCGHAAIDRSGLVEPCWCDGGKND